MAYTLLILGLAALFLCDKHLSAYWQFTTKINEANAQVLAVSLQLTAINAKLNALTQSVSDVTIKQGFS